MRHILALMLDDAQAARRRGDLRHAAGVLAMLRTFRINTASFR